MGAARRLLAAALVIAGCTVPGVALAQAPAPPPTDAAPSPEPTPTPSPEPVPRTPGGEPVDPDTAERPSAPPAPPAVELAPDYDATLDTAQISGALARLQALDTRTAALSDSIAAATAALATRRAELAAAEATANAAETGRVRADADAADAVRSVDVLVQAAYHGSSSGPLLATLNSGSPEELLDRMTMLDSLAGDVAARKDAAAAALRAADNAAATATQARGYADDAVAAAFTAQGVVVDQRRELAQQSQEAGALLATLLAQDRAAVADTAALTRSEGLDAARRAALARDRTTFVVLPVLGTFTSGYGMRNGAAHRGVDIANAIGTPIVSAADGVVINAGPARGFGLWVRVQHYDGTITVYGHVDQLFVIPGQRVGAGELIATVGDRGESTGPHLHFEVIDPDGEHVDPQPWLAARGIML